MRGTSRHCIGNAMVGESNRREEALKLFQTEAGKQGRGVTGLVINGELCGLRTVADATRQISASMRLPLV